jgi:hypothetical protein
VEVGNFHACIITHSRRIARTKWRSLCIFV